MKKMLIITSAIIVCLYAHAQTEFAPIGAEWYYSYTIACCPEDHLNHIISEKDTIIEGNNCHVIRQYYDNSNIASEKYIIKQEQGKVYYYYQNQFSLLFDFDAKVNDTVKFSFMYQERDTNWIIKDTLLSIRFKIENITTDANNFKTFKTKALDNMPPFYAQWFSIYSYSEKIGSHIVFIPRLDNLDHPDAEHYWWLRCYLDEDLTYISNQWAAFDLPCNYSIYSDINEQKNIEDIKIYPNPASQFLNIKIRDEYRNAISNIKILDMLGNVVYNQLYNNDCINISNIKSGIYLLLISMDEKKIMKKLVIY
jgi:hypothetical protein